MSLRSYFGKKFAARAVNETRRYASGGLIRTLIECIVAILTYRHAIHNGFDHAIERAIFKSPASIMTCFGDQISRSVVAKVAVLAATTPRIETVALSTESKSIAHTSPDVAGPVSRQINAKVLVIALICSLKTMLYTTIAQQLILFNSFCIPAE